MKTAKRKNTQKRVKNHVPVDVDIRTTRKNKGVYTGTYKGHEIEIINMSEMVNKPNEWIVVVDHKDASIHSRKKYGLEHAQEMIDKQTAA